VISALVATMFGFGAGVANAAASTSFIIQTKAVAAKSGIPYKMTMTVSKTAGQPSAFLGISFSRNKTTLTASLHQSHNYSFTIPASDVTVDARDLIPTKVNTGTDLHKFGTI